MPNDTSTSMLSIQHLDVFYGGVHALRDVNIEVPRGAVVTLIGANGAGKSSTLRSVCGLVRNIKGKIIYDGMDITQERPFDRVALGIAMVPEGRRIFTNLTVFENLRLGAYTIKDKKSLSSDLEKIYHLFPRLLERTNQRALTLSGGEQQMLAVGRALMSRPRLLLMDEPSLGLAPNLVVEMYDTFEKIHQEGITILVVEQNARLALKLSDYGYVLEVGSVVLHGPSAELALDEGVKRAYIGA
jgi:branched-chain amino acid transport system ATP-binding protein